MGICSSRCTSTARLDGQTAIITGCNTGIGKITVNDLYKRGCRVIMACRDLEKAFAAHNEILKESQECDNVGQIVLKQLDLSSLESVRKFSSQILAEEQKINILINNAGVMACPLSFTADGFELQFGTNHLGHFLLTLLLLRRIIESAPSRIINVSSIAHKYADALDFNNLNAEKSYTPTKNYALSKLANILFTKELSRRLKGIDVKVYALHPGVVNTELSRHIDTLLFSGATSIYQFLGSCFMKSPEQGAQTIIHCAVDEQAGRETGLYYSECKPASVTAAAANSELAERLWEVSLQMVKLENFDAFKETSLKKSTEELKSAVSDHSENYFLTDIES